MLNSDQMTGMQQQVTGLVWQTVGAMVGNSNWVLKGRALRVRGYLRSRLGSALQSGQRRMRELRLDRGVSLTGRAS
ncbi:MAG: hypothetical protein ABIZ64_13310 [Casimicrobium sp.]|jgi:uncharacterized protein YjbJ (UPF0337 family)